MVSGLSRKNTWNSRFDGSVSLDEHRDKLPQSGPIPPPADEDETGSLGGIPEEAGEIIEIIDDEEPRPAATPRPIQADFPEEALRELRNLRSQLDRKDKQIEQVMEAYRAKKAETEKLRHRIEKTERRRFEQSKGDFIARFVEVLDNLDRAIESIENAFDPDSVLQGIMLVRSRLVQLLKEEGLEKIFVRGQTYDPSHSEAAGMEPVKDKSEDGIVIKELQPGYMLKGSLLRAARVIVGSFGQEQGSESSKPSSQPPSVAPEPSEDSGDDWEANDVSGHKLEFSEDGLDFSND
jgi:molecular chaperone GrpE